MRHLLLLLTIGLVLTSCATVKTGSFKAKTEQVQNSKSKLDNYVAANEWMVEKFNSAEDVIQFADKEAGIVKGKYTLNYAAPVYYGYGYSTPARLSTAIITIRVKDSVAKIELKATNVNYVANKGHNIPTLDVYAAKLRALMEDFKNYMND